MICDTAGLRHSVDPVENEGLRRAKEVAATADLVIIVMDASRGPESLWQRPVKDLIRHECERLNLSFSKKKIRFNFLFSIFPTFFTLQMLNNLKTTTSSC